MNRIKFDATLMSYISIFENITRCQPKDCFVNNNMLLFIVQQDDIAKAIGKHGANAKMLEKVLKRKIKIVELNPELTQLIQNLIYH